MTLNITPVCFIIFIKAANAAGIIWTKQMLRPSTLCFFITIISQYRSAKHRLRSFIVYSICYNNKAFYNFYVANATEIIGRSKCFALQLFVFNTIISQHRSAKHPLRRHYFYSICYNSCVFINFIKAVNASPNMKL